MYEKTEILKKIYQEIFTYEPWYIFLYFHMYLYPEKYLPACMELVLNAPFHLDSLGRPVLDVTRTVNHLGGHHDYMMASF